MLDRIRRLLAFRAAMEELSSMDDEIRRDLCVARSDFARIAAIYSGLLQRTDDADERIDRTAAFPRRKSIR